MLAPTERKSSERKHQKGAERNFEFGNLKVEGLDRPEAQIAVKTGSETCVRLTEVYIVQTTQRVAAETLDFRRGRTNERF